MLKLARLFYTVKHLRLRQIYYRLWYKLKHQTPTLKCAPHLRAVVGSWGLPVPKLYSKYDDGTCCFLNQTINIDSKEIWNDAAIDKLWLYNLHYFDVIDANLIARWVDENAPGKGIGWEPYPISLRIVNWIKFALNGGQLSSAAVNSLAIQARFLDKRLEFHLLGNHLFVNLKALIFAGLFFSGAEAEKWFKHGFNLLQKELCEQVLSDGAHFELSPMYHCIILEDMLDLINIMGAYGYDFPNSWSRLINKMFSWLQKMRHPDGEIAFFNDAALGVAPTYVELCKYAARLSVEINDLEQENASGYWRLEREEAVVLIDAAAIGPDYLPGHAHADSLSFELSLGGRRLLVNSGVSCYGVSDERLRQRGTAAHNTLVIDGENSSEVWSGFRVARRAQIFDVVATNAELTASHDGYMRLSGKPVHRRSWSLTDDSLFVKDRVHGAGRHSIAIYFHFAPGLHIECNEKKFVVMRNDKIVAQILFTMGIDRQFMAKIVSGSYHPEFGLSLPNEQLIVEYQGELPFEFDTEIAWR